MLIEWITSITLEGWILVLLCTAFFTLAGNLLFSSKAEMIHKRIESLNIFTTGTEEEKIKQKSLFDRIKIMIEERMGRFIAQNIKKGRLAPLELKIKQAHVDMDPIQFWTQKFLYAMGLSALSLLLAKPLLTLGIALLGFFLPDIRLNDQMKKRQFRIKSELPDFLDLLASTAPSSKNLEDAIKRVCARTTGEVTNEFVRALEEVNAGRRTRDALKELALRCGVPEIDTLVAQINQAEAFGTGVEKTLQVQAEKMRKLKKQLAEIKARNASVTLVLPSLFLLVTILIMIAGPSVISIVGLGNIF